MDAFDVPGKTVSQQVRGDPSVGDVGEVSGDS